MKILLDDNLIARVAVAFLAIFPLAFQPVPAAPDEQLVFPVSPPPFTAGIFPCSDCHDPIEEPIEPHKLEEEHMDIKLHHAEELRWCLDCHDSQDRDKLFLQNGTKIDYSESHRLCGQCHGPVYRDWRAGIHGKRTGYWNGRKEYLLCAHCHNPHDPRFKPIKPEPPPMIPLP